MGTSLGAGLGGSLTGSYGTSLTFLHVPAPMPKSSSPRSAIQSNIDGAHPVSSWPGEWVGEKTQAVPVVMGLESVVVIEEKGEGGHKGLRMVITNKADDEIREQRQGMTLSK